MWKEFKAFLLRGDVLALAVAVIIGGAFQKIVDSLVTDVITPVIGLLGGNPDFSAIVIGGKTVVQPDGSTKVEGGIMVGRFLNAVISFITIGFVLFALVKASGKKAEEVK